MCKCEEQGLSTVVGMEKYSCNLKINENCVKCVENAKIVANEYFSKISEATGVEITGFEK